MIIDSLPDDAKVTLKKYDVTSAHKIHGPNVALFSAGPPSTTLTQHQTNIGTSSSVCWDGNAVRRVWQMMY